MDLIKSAEFEVSNSDPGKCPAPIFPEFAFIGRSNVGKSSLINMLVNRKSLAKTSSTPGKTQLINHFIINKGEKNPWYIVDLPGYGFAKAPLKEKEKWDRMIKAYLAQRENLMCVMVLLDIRHEAQKIDLKFMERLGEDRIPFVMVFTKADKLSPGAIEKSVRAYERAMGAIWESLPQIFITSADRQTGREEVVRFMVETNKFFKPQP